MNKKKYQNYINAFKEKLAGFLKPEIGLSCNIFPSIDGGAILEFIIGKATENDDTYKKTSQSLGVALSNIEQRAFGGSLENYHFSGTNTILETNRIIFIKESNPKEWSDETAQKDVQSLIESSQRAKNE